LRGIGGQLAGITAAYRRQKQFLTRPMVSAHESHPLAIWGEARIEIADDKIIRCGEPRFPAG